MIITSRNGVTLPVSGASRTLTDLADVVVTGTATLLRAASVGRVFLSGTNTHASVAIRVGGATTSATRGQRVAAGAAFETTTQGAVYAASEGADVTTSLSEETN